MPINPAIAMGVQPIQIADPLAQYGKIAAIQNAQNQNALAQFQLGAAQREELAQNALSEAYKTAYNPQTGEYDVNKLRGAVISAGAGARLPDIEKKMGELRTQQLAQRKAEGDLIEQRLKLSRQGLDTVRTPEEYIAWDESNHRDPVLGPYIKSRGITPEQSRANILAKLQQPGGFQQLLLGSALGLEKLSEQHFAQQDTGGTSRTLAMSKYAVPGMPSAAAVVPKSEVQKTLTPGEAKPTVSNVDIGGAIITQEYDPRTRTTRVLETRPKSLTPEQSRAAAQEKDKVAHTTTDEAGNVTLYNMFGQIIGARDASGAPVAIKGKPSATFEKTRNQREQLQKDLNTAIFELKDAVKEGGLIDQSTGSGVGRAADVAMRFVGRANEGDIAIGKLKPIADIVLKMVPRFEGPQSDKDTQSYKEAAGQLADPSMPRAIRKAAAQTIIRLMENRKGQFVSSDMAAEGAGPGGGVDTSNPLLAPPAGR